MKQKTVFSPSRLILLLLSAVFPVAASAGPLVAEASRSIDALVEEALSAKGMARNPELSDEVFARRAFLDVSGRIPTYSELTAFLLSKDPAKREKLISDLLDSPGYVSHFYNYWEDVLRIKSRGRRADLVLYQDWIKESLRENLPYDEFVKRLLLSEGFVWEDPAVGYYVRDAGMPLDNVANTMQVFSGTRMQCAQCHDHPFDKWTQKQYYHLSAFTYGLKTQSRTRDIEAYQDFQRMVRAAARKKIAREGGDPKDRKAYRNMFSGPERRAMQDIFRPFQAEVRPSERKLKLPDDYPYDDGRPRQLVSPETPFGDEVKVKRSDDPREVFADWLVSPRNPRFSRVIANRLWKKAFGVGLVEPVDDFRDDAKVGNPPLMDYLEKLVVDYDYDLKRFYEVILNTRTYQSEVSPLEVAPDQEYDFQGPALRRMKAEQLWDSILVLGVRDLDARLGGDPQMVSLRERTVAQQAHVEDVRKLDANKMYGIVKYVGKAEAKFIEIEKEYQEKLAQLTEAKDKRTLRREYAKIRREKRNILENALATVTGRSKEESAGPFYAMADEDQMMQSAQQNREGRKATKFRANLVRASEIVSPAPAGHFLRQFGESDREIIENSNTEASVPQALSLLNGQPLNLLLQKGSPLSRSVGKAASADEREDVLFMSFFGRKPSESERGLMREQLERHGSFKGYRMMVAALLNAQEFRFIQ